ncbi:MAG: AMP-binding protein [Gammaproteobacteria bacterium]|nr:AMP-binding protein [Gammaproteobacteria bacterium]MDP2141125.1 AMP-binding protein [Gammaproteobacteria bacterium]MDP2349200.1 AMP-binding protein [Gammaproteobacteria bacterium]
MITTHTTVLTGDMDPNLFATLPALYDYSCRKFVDKPAFSALGKTITYGELHHYSQLFADYLLDQTDLKPGDRIAIQLPNVLQFPIAAIGALKAGLILVNTNPLYTAREMKQQFKDSGAKAVVILVNFCDKLERILPETDIDTVITTELGDMLPSLKRVVVNAGVRYLKKMVPAFNLPNAKPWTSIFKSQGVPSERAPVDSGTDTAIILYTGGTTGVAKGAMLTHQNLLANMMQLRAVSKPVIYDGRDTIIAPLPLYHTYAFMFHCLTMIYAGNHSVLIPNPRDIDGLVKVMRSTKANGFVGINTLYLALCRHKDIEKVDFSDMRFSGAGGMALTINVAQEWTRITNCEVFEGYGLTECSPVVTVNPPGHVKLGTVGPAVPETQIKVVDDNGVELGLDEKGELLVKGPQVMKGYWQNEKATQEALTDNWFRTGDYAQIDSDGYVKIVDRKKDMIIVSGFNVFPSEIEELINSHPDVFESAVIGIPNEKSGELVKLFIVPRNFSLKTETIHEFCKTNLTPYKVPKEIVFVKDLPKSNVGKILRRELREREIQGESA